MMHCTTPRILLNLKSFRPSSELRLAGQRTLIWAGPGAYLRSPPLLGAYRIILSQLCSCAGQLEPTSEGYLMSLIEQ
jgi:hypothetical protein